MENFLKVFQTTWEIDIKARFEQGLIAYERQLQSILYSQLRARLTNDYEIYIEPVIYQLDQIKPDMIVTKENKIISVIELKSKAWEYPNFTGDIKKLERFKTDLEINTEIVLGWIPESVNWYDQDKQEKMKLKYQVDKDMLLIMALISRFDSEVISKNIDDLTDVNSKYLKIFLGYIDINNKIVFKAK